METLHLNLKRKWFDMILSGEKTEEYRDLTNYWFKRLAGVCIDNEIPSDDLSSTVVYSSLSQNSDIINRLLAENPKDFLTITFSNGYSIDRPYFEIYLLGIEIREGNPCWGAESGKKYFVLKLGEIKPNNR